MQDFLKKIDPKARRTEPPLDRVSEESTPDEAEEDESGGQALPLDELLQADEDVGALQRSETD